MQSEEPLEIKRARQLFSFLKAFAEKNTPPERDIANHLWKLRLRSLPEHPCISVGEVHTDEQDDGSVGRSVASDALLIVQRPTLTPAPRPPEVLREFLKPGWEKADGALELHASIPRRQDDDTVLEAFDADPTRVVALSEWRTRWLAWSEAEKPALAAMQIFSRLYDLHGRIERESEQVELVLGDGLLRWRQANHTINHPILLQRVELHFDASVPEFRVIDADRDPELYSAAFYNEEYISAAVVNRLREELARGGYHPLNNQETTAYLRRFAQSLGAGSTFSEEPVSDQATPDAAVVRDPVLFLRTRPSGFAAAFDRVLVDLEKREVLPVGLTRLVGVEPPPASEPITETNSPWGEPEDVLLSKPANAEQIRIARALERHKAILVQGPPGTGKSHTIANLIGHLVAQGKRVLVTSHTTKALRVLRDQIVPSLQPLCVAALDTDLESRKQMEDAVRGILSRLTDSSEEQLENEVARLTTQRTELNQRITQITRDLQTARSAEYEPIVFNGESIDPVKAACWVHDNEHGNDWIPGPVEAGSPLPISEAELFELYATNAKVDPNEGEEIARGLPARETLTDPDDFISLVESLGVSPDEYTVFWDGAPEEQRLDALQTLADLVEDAVRDIQAMTSWQREVVAAGYAGVSEAEIWKDLATLVQSAADAWARHRRLLLDHDVIVDYEDPEALSAAISEINDHVAAGGSLNSLTLLMRGRWKSAIRACRVNGTSPSTVLHFKAISAHLAIQQGRARIAARWRRQAEPAGLPAIEAMPTPPEPSLLELVGQFEDLLCWWNERWRAIEAAMENAGLEWREMRQAIVARSDPAKPFDRDLAILVGPLKAAVANRVALARAERAKRLLQEMDTSLAPFEGPCCVAVRRAVQERNAQAYADAWTALIRLIAKKEVVERRLELLDRVRAAAPRWAEHVAKRNGVHASSSIPGDASTAWRWRQLQQEIERRAALDESALAEKLEQCRAQLRNITAALIDGKAWLAQIRRTNLEARQALQGWSDIQRRIGRGTGRRVPALQAEARKLLAKASGAVPVWIMPLSRVAESFDPRSRFDVVIIDEASQSDVTGLLAWYLGDRIAVVGDHEQVSPLAVGERIEVMSALIAQHLQDIPNNMLYDGRASIYDLARQCFGGLISLWEHFRCVPDIIEFSNELSYDFQIRPLRNAAAVAKPHVVEYVVPPALTTERSGKTNLAEAHVIVALLKAATELQEYDNKTFGAISLLGDEQAGLIQDLAVASIDAVELEKRRFVAGSPAQFQGDERHVVFLSMVDTPTGSRLRLSQTDAVKQRYNVAASRAKDQLWLIHSLDPNRDLHPDDLRYRLVNYVRNPGARRREAERANARAESPFERAIINRLVAAGYRVEPQVWVGRYRIDMVVSDGSRQVAVECDGDRFHGLDQIPHDMARQAVLERAGWRFIRIRGTRFYRHSERTTQWLFDELTRVGVKPSGVHEDPAPLDHDAAAARERIIRRAWDIMRESGWIPEPPDNTIG